jgi:hypothetical protein
MENEILVSAIIHFPDLSFNSDQWGWKDAIVKWDEESYEHQWVGLKKQNGSEIYFENTYSLSDGKWFFLRGLTLAKVYQQNEEYHLLSDEGIVLIAFNSFPSDPTDLRADRMDIFDEDKWKNVTYCFDFFERVSTRSLQEINFGYDKVFEEETNKYFLRDPQDYWASCEFDNLDTSWNILGVGARSLTYDRIFNFLDHNSTCLVENNKRYAIINRWFQRITPWFDDFVDNEKLSEIIDAEATIPEHLIPVRINNEVLFLELCGNFVHDKIFNPLAFFTDLNNAKKLYDPCLVFNIEENDKDSHTYAPQELIEDGTIRIAIEEDYIELEGSVLYPWIVPFYMGFMNYFALRYNVGVMRKFVEDHNACMGITPSGYRIARRFQITKSKPVVLDMNTKPTGLSPYNPEPGTNPKPKSSLFFKK